MALVRLFHPRAGPPAAEAPVSSAGGGSEKGYHAEKVGSSTVEEVASVAQSDFDTSQEDDLNPGGLTFQEGQLDNQYPCRLPSFGC